MENNINNKQQQHQEQQQQQQQQHSIKQREVGGEKTQQPTYLEANCIEQGLHDFRRSRDFVALSLLKSHKIIHNCLDVGWEFDVQCFSKL
jgi:hypothetical protein